MWVLWREALATTWANKVPSVLVTLLVAVMVTATLSTVGRTAAAEQQLAQRLDDAGARVLTVTDLRSRGLLSPSIIGAAGALSVAERAVGITLTVDMVAGHVGRGGERVPAWGIVGDINDVATITAGRAPGPGEGIVSEEGMRKLGLQDPYGWALEAAQQGSQEATIVGAFRPKAPFEEFDAGIAYNASDADALTLSVIIDDSRHAASAQRAVLGLIAPPDPSEIQVESPVGIAELRRQVLGDFGNFGRTLMLGVLGGGALLTAIVVLSDVLVRRKDLGRRRALGATRATIVAIVTCRTLLPALIGAALGVAVGAGVTGRLGAVPPTDFVGAVAVLAVLAATISAVPPALFAATRDPVAVLRTP